MVANPPDNVPRLAPHLFYDDVAAAMDWLVEAFGFVDIMRMEENGVLVHGELEIGGDSQIMLGLTSDNKERKSPRTLNNMVPEDLDYDLISQRLFIYVDDIDAHAEQARKTGAKMMYEPVTQFYGDRVYECIDLEGHRWKFGQHVFDVDMQTLQRPEGF